MMPSILRIRLVLVFVLAGIFSAGCAGQKTRFYVLSPLDSGVGLVNETQEKGSLSVEITSLRLPRYLERPQIVTRTGQNRVERAEFHQWGGSLRKNMIRVLARNLSQLLATPHIAVSPHRLPAPPGFRIELAVMQFERDSDGQVRLSAQWRLSRGKDRKPLATQITELKTPVVEGEEDFENTVAAMSTLFGELSRIVAEAILEHVDGTSGTGEGRE